MSFPTAAPTATPTAIRCYYPSYYPYHRSGTRAPISKRAFVYQDGVTAALVVTGERTSKALLLGQLMLPSLAR